MREERKGRGKWGGETIGKQNKRGRGGQRKDKVKESKGVKEKE